MDTSVAIGKRRFQCRLPGSEVAAQQARRVVGDVDELSRFPDLRFAAELLTSELVANCVRHAGLGAGDVVLLSVESSEETVWVEVASAGPGFDPLALLIAYRRSNERHRGIFLLDALVDRWGFRRGDGCRVWFEIDLVPGRRPWRGRDPISARPR